MELGKYKRALKASTRPKHLRRVVYQPEIGDTDVDFPSADQPFNRFAGGGLVRKLFAKLKRELPVGNDTETLMQAKALTKAVEGKPMNDAEIDMLMRSSIMDDTMQRMVDDMDMSETEAYDTLVKTMQIGKPQNREGFSKGGRGYVKLEDQNIKGRMSREELIKFIKANKNLSNIEKVKKLNEQGKLTQRAKPFTQGNLQKFINAEKLGEYSPVAQRVAGKEDTRQAARAILDKLPKGSKVSQADIVKNSFFKRKTAYDILKKEYPSLKPVGREEFIAQRTKEGYESGKYSTDTKSQRSVKINKKRRDIINDISNFQFEDKIRVFKKGAPLDQAHRLSIEQSRKLNNLYNVVNLGLDSIETNRKTIKPFENALERQYAIQNKLVKQAQKFDRVPVDLQNKLSEVNENISEIVARSEGRLQGIHVDERTLQPKVTGVDFSKSVDFGVVDKPIKELTQTDFGIIQENLKNNLSKIEAQEATNAIANLACPGQYADGGRVKFSRGSECYAKGLQILDDAKFGDEKAKAKVAKGMKALKVLGGIGTELLFETAFLLPSIAEGKPLDVLIGESTLGYLGLGTSEDEKTIEMSGNDPRVIRYVAAKRAFEDNKQIPLKQEQMVPGLDDDFYQNMEERKKANRAVYEKFVRSNDRDAAAAANKLAEQRKQKLYDENKKGLPARTAQAILEQLNKTFIGQTEPGEVFDLAEFQDGGRVGFENGGFTRRGFLKGLAALAAVIAGLRTGKGTKVVPKTTTAKQVVENAGKGTPEWFAPLVDKIKTEGIDVPPENVMRTSGRETVTKLEVKDPVANTKDSYYLFENPDTGEVRIDVDALGVGANDGEFSLYMRPRRVEGLTDEGIQQIDEGEFFVTEDRAVGRMSGPDDYEMDLEAFDTDLSGSASNWHQLEEFATGKTDKAAQTEQLKKKDFIERNPGDDIENRYGVYDPPEPDDYD